MSNNYKHITLEGVSHIQAVNPFDIKVGLTSHLSDKFDKANPPIIWYGEAFDGTISEEEIEKPFYEIESPSGKWVELPPTVNADDAEFYKSKGANIRLAARPKEVADHIGEINGMVNQPVQQEANHQVEIAGEWFDCSSFRKSQLEQFALDGNTFRTTPVQPSTPIVEEQREEITTLQWKSRYLDTLEDDDRGRWGRICYAGKVPFINSRKAMFEIAWVKKLDHEEGMKFTVHPSFPYSGKHYFDKLHEAKNAVEREFEWFVHNSLSSPIQSPNREEGRELQGLLPSSEDIEANGIEGGLRDNELQLFWEGATWLKNHLLKKLSPSSTPLEQKELKEMDSITDEDKSELGRIYHGISVEEWDVNNSGFLIDHAFRWVKENKNMPFDIAIKIYRYLSQKGYKL